MKIAVEAPRFEHDFAMVIDQGEVLGSHLVSGDDRQVIRRCDRGNSNQCAKDSDQNAIVPFKNVKTGLDFN